MKLNYLFVFATVLALLFSCKKDPVNNTTPTVSTQYTLGSGGNCTGAVAAGMYKKGTALTTANTLALQVNVTAPGAYSIYTDTVNGIYFSKTGTFTTTGTQTVTLAGSGTPTANGINNYSIHADGNTCITSVSAVADTITCLFNGVAYNFSKTMYNSFIYDPGVNFKIYGQNVLATNTNFSIWIQHPTFNPLTAGTYSVNSSGFYVIGQYTTANYNYWLDASNGTTQYSYPFTVVLTSVSPTQVIGTFSGVIWENAGTGPNYMYVTNGYFDIHF